MRQAMTTRAKLLQYSHMFQYLKLNTPAKLAACFQMGRKRWREDSLNLSVGNDDRNAPTKITRSGSETIQTEL